MQWQVTTARSYATCDLPPDYDVNELVERGAFAWINSISHLTPQQKKSEHYRDYVLHVYQRRFKFNCMHRSRLRAIRKRMWADNLIVRQKIEDDWFSQLGQQYNAFDSMFGPSSDYPDSGDESTFLGRLRDDSSLAPWISDLSEAHAEFPSKFDRSHVLETSAWKARSQGDLTDAQVFNASLRDLYPEIYIPSSDALEQGHGGTEHFQKIIFENGKRRKVVQYRHAESLAVGDPSVDLDLHVDAGVPTESHLQLPASDPWQGMPRTTKRNSKGEIIETWI